MLRILVTGASGFVGRGVIERLRSSAAYDVRGAVRRDDVERAAGVDYRVVRSFDGKTDWLAALEGCDAVIHTAARVHVMRERAADPLAEFRRANVDATLEFARQVVAAGVRRFVFVSSIKVNGEATEPGRPFTADDAPAPLDAYGRSKLEAEQALRALLEQAGHEWVVVRPTLVYGPGVKANFAALLRWLRRGVPLPFAAVHNRRSFTGLTNLAALLECCATRTEAANQVFLAADGEDLSTPDLLRRLAAAMGTRARLVAVPPAALRAVAALAGRRDLAQRLLGNLQVDASKARARLDWSPPQSVDAGLELTARAFLAQERA